ncbi:MAG: trypsin-like peptidase domain-containing protein [Ruminococcus sp.]|nr:trypsin-like peptidase domain-containing protein [Ruminococcus sp.]
MGGYTDSSYSAGGFSTDPGNSPKKPKKHTGMKIAAAIMAMAIVSGGSIAAYRALSPETVGTVVVSEDSTNTAASKTAADTVSMFETKQASGDEMATEDIVDKVLPSVVGIESEFTITSSYGSGYYFFGGFGGNQQQEQTATATGTGVIITDNGYIVTNAHVIYDSEYGGGVADSITVLLSDESSYDAEVIGYDTDCDLAVLKINATGLTAAEFGDSDSLRLGESVIAIGNPLGFELMDTVTGGMISGLNRNITINDKAMTLIQTDAAINSGNSGGPLINKYGQVIGINSSKMSSSYSSSSASIEGIGFAIPSNEVSAIVDDIMQYGYVTGKPQFGISCQDVTETISQMYNMPVGVYVTVVTEGSAADKAGIQSGDIITAVDGVTVTTADELNEQKNLHSAGDTVEITLTRAGEEITLSVTLDEVTQNS